MPDPWQYCFGCMNQLPALNGVCPVCKHDNRVRQNGNGELPFARLAGKYLVGRSLGRGGFGITYVGLNEKIGKRIAIKEYFPADIAERCADGINVRPSSPEWAEEFERGKKKALDEARTVTTVSSIPGVVQVYDCFNQNGTTYIIMEFVEGDTLSDIIAQKGPMKWKEAWNIMSPIGMTLQLLHTRGMVHRDVSPDNVMLTRADKRSVLLDFGAASHTFGSGEKHARLQKDGYAAAEQYREDSAIDGRTDEYAWCATFYMLLTGIRPVPSVQRLYGGSELIPPKKKHSDIQKAAQSVLMKGMSVSPDDRYPDMGQLLAELDDAQEAPPSWRRGAIIAAASSAAVGLVVAGVGMLG